MDDFFINDVNLGETFNNMKPGENNVYLDLEAAKENSINVQVIERETRLENMDMEVLRKRILKIVTTAVGVLVALNMSLNVVDSLNSLLRMENMSREIGSIVRQVEDPGKSTILSQNTYRNANGPYYNHEGIAKDLLTLDSSVFDYALCAVCNDMGNNINNPVGIHDISNIDYVIFYLKMYSREDGKYFNQYVSEVFRDVNSLNDYLIKNNFVDGGGNPSLDAFKVACNNNAQDVYDIIKSQVSNKGAGL